MAENKKFTKLINSDGTKQAVALDKVSFDDKTKKLTLYSSVDNSIKEETTIPASEVDTTLSKSGLAADAKATGDAVKDVVKVGGTASGFTGIIVGTGEEEIELVEQKDFDAEIAKLNAKVGTPLVANAASAMVDTTKIYVYTGNENGYVNGNWYFYNGTNWESGGVYNAVAVQTDKTLTQENKAADAKKTGDDISELKEDLTDKADTVDMLKAFPTDTASGAVASFADGANVPVKSLIVNIDPVQSGSGDPSPTNVRPISGWSEVNVQRAGENLFPYKDVESQTKNGVTFTVEKSNGVITNIHMQGTATTAFPFTFYLNAEDEPWVLPKGDFKLYIGGDKPASRQIFDINVRKYGTTLDISAAASEATITLSEQTAFGSAYIWVYSGAVLNHNIIPVIVQSGVDTSVKYPITQRQSINIQLGQTVYGGTLDVTKGELVIDRAMVDLGTLTWNKNAPNNVFYAPFSGNADKNPSALGYKYISSEWVYGKSVNNLWDASNDGLVVEPTGVSATPRIYARSQIYDGFTAVEFASAMSGVQLVYELESPITVTLSPNELSTLLGANNIWSDAGDTEVTYRADPTLYISRLTEPDADMVADSNITSGQYFMVGNTLYKATANIASGGAITPNVNCVRKSLSEALNELNA